MIRIINIFYINFVKNISLNFLDKSILTADKFDKWKQYGDFNVSPLAIAALTDGKSLAWLLKHDPDIELEEPIEDLVARAIYGESKQPPGDFLRTYFRI